LTFCFLISHFTDIEPLDVLTIHFVDDEEDSSVDDSEPLTERLLFGCQVAAGRDVPAGERELEDEGESSNVTLDSNHSNNLLIPIFRKRELASLFVGNRFVL
jgi:hypothetical protein